LEEFSPVEFASADTTGAVKAIWYYGSDVAKEEVENTLAENTGVLITGFRLAKNLVICGAGCKVRKVKSVSVGMQHVTLAIVTLVHTTESNTRYQ